MAYADLEDITNHFNIYAIAQLTDDETSRVIIEPIVEECIETASDYTDTTLPARLLLNSRTARFVTIQKTMVLLYRRYGHIQEAESLEMSLNTTIQSIIAASQESGRNKYNYNTVYHSTTPLYTQTEWKNAITGG